MARRLSYLALVIAFSFTARAMAQDVPPEIENAKNSAIGTINADAVYVRSGAGETWASCKVRGRSAGWAQTWHFKSSFP